MEKEEGAPAAGRGDERRLSAMAGLWRRGEVDWAKARQAAQVAMVAMGLNLGIVLAQALSIRVAVGAVAFLALQQAGAMWGPAGGSEEGGQAVATWTAQLPGLDGAMCGFVILGAFVGFGACMNFFVDGVSRSQWRKWDETPLLGGAWLFGFGAAAAWGRADPDIWSNGPLALAAAWAGSKAVAGAGRWLAEAVAWMAVEEGREQAGRWTHALGMDRAGGGNGWPPAASDMPWRLEGWLLDLAKGGGNPWAEPSGRRSRWARRATAWLVPRMPRGAFAKTLGASHLDMDAQYAMALASWASPEGLAAIEERREIERAAPAGGGGTELSGGQARPCRL
jgi:hypothetical protein